MIIFIFKKSIRKGVGGTKFNLEIWTLALFQNLDLCDDRAKK
jgi:hypothetical protein